MGRGDSPPTRNAILQTGVSTNNPDCWCDGDTTTASSLHLANSTGFIDGVIRIESILLQVNFELTLGCTLRSIEGMRIDGASLCYGIVGETDSDGEFPFGISVARTQSIEQQLIDQTVIELLRLCRTFNGDYEGWETPIVTR